MRKMWKTLVSLITVLALCAGMGTMAFASEGSAEDVSLDDILGLLSSLNTEEVVDEAEEEVAVGEAEEVAAGTHNVGGVTFSIPEDMLDLGESDGAYAYIDSTFTNVIAITYMDYDGEEVSLSSEIYQKLMVAGIESEGSVVSDYSVIDIDGHTAMDIQYSQDVDGLTVVGRSLVLELQDGLFVAAVTSNESDPAPVFDAFVASIQIDESGAPEAAPAADPGKDSLVGAGTGAMEVPADAIDATTMDEVVLLDDDLCTVSIKGFEVPDDDWYGYKVKMFVDNKSDQELRFSADYISLNGYVLNPYWGETVAGGHKSNSEMTFYLEDMAANNITDVNELGLKVVVRNEDYDDLDTGYFTILPNGTDAPAQPEQVFPDDAQVLVDNDVLTLIVTGAPYSDDYYTSIPVYVENHTDNVIALSAYGSSAVNGYEVYTGLYGAIPGGKKMNTTIYWDNDDLAENDIDTIEEVELELTVSDDEDWSVDDYYSDVINFTVQ